MLDTEEIVINTGPLIALVAALGDLQVLAVYRRVLVPFEVCEEIRAGGSTGFAVGEFEKATGLQKLEKPIEIAPILMNSLGKGEAAVIQLAQDEKIPTVCIDEAVGRRIARLSELSVTGSIGVLLRAKREGHPFSMQEAIQKMRDKGIWLSERVVNFALTQARETGA